MVTVEVGTHSLDVFASVFSSKCVGLDNTLHLDLFMTDCLTVARACPSGLS